MLINTEKATDKAQRLASGPLMHLHPFGYMLPIIAAAAAGIA
jgi:hypothetical protein